MEEVLNTIYEGIIAGDASLVVEKVKEAISNDMDPGMVLNKGMISAMSEVGRLFEEGEYFVPEMLIAARAMQNGMMILKPLLQQADVKATGRVAIGTVKGDLHDIGKNLVAMMLEGAGFEILDLGTDVSPEKFVNSVTANNVNVIAMSALLTTTMSNMKSTVDALKNAGLREKVIVLVGGAPVTDQYAQQIGADGYAPDASRAVAIAKTLVG